MKKQSIALLLCMAATGVQAYDWQPGAKLYSSDGTYLGNVNSNKYDVNSISNPYGQYGNKYSSKSINNPYSEYGNPYSQKYVNPNSFNLYGK